MLYSLEFVGIVNALIALVEGGQHGGFWGSVRNCKTRQRNIVFVHASVVSEWSEVLFSWNLASPEPCDNFSREQFLDFMRVICFCSVHHCLVALVVSPEKARRDPANDKELQKEGNMSFRQVLQVAPHPDTECSIIIALDMPEPIFWTWPRKKLKSSCKQDRDSYILDTPHLFTPV